MATQALDIASYLDYPLVGAVVRTFGSHRVSTCNREPRVANKKKTEAAQIIDQVFAAYALTPAEIRTTRYLCDGYSVAEITQELNVSVHTVRTHLKRAFSKTDTHSQEELVKRLTGLMR